MPPPDGPACGRHVATVCGAVAGEDWVALRRVLHPAVRFTDPEGRTTRGRTKVIGLLRDLDTLDEPAVIELRDGRVGVWTCAPPSSDTRWDTR